MQQSTTRLGLFTLVSMIILLCASCSGGRIAQCNRMVKVANNGAEIGKKLSRISNNQDAESIITTYSEAAIQLGKISTDMKGLDISDMKLKGFQSRFFNLYQDTKKGLEHINDAVRAKNMTNVYQSIEELKMGVSREHDLVIDVNKYCAGK
jgi:hypothetical protein